MSHFPSPDAGVPLRLTIPPDLSRLSDVRVWAWEVGSGASLSEARIFDLQVTVSEATANAIEHAASAVELTAWLLPDRLLVEVTNDGVFQPGLYKDDDRRRRGLGLPLIVSLADQVHISRLPSDKTQVSLTFFRDGTQEPSREPRVSASQAESLASGEKRLSRRVIALLLLPLLLLVVSVAILYALGVSGVRDSAAIYTAGNTLFISGAAIVIAYLAAQSYLFTRSVAVLALGTAALIFGVAYLLAGPLIPDENDSVTIHNISMLVAGALFALSGYWTWRERRQFQPRVSPQQEVFLAYLAALLFMALLTVLTLTDLLPAFFVPGQDYTVLREAVLGLGAIGFLSASVLFALVYRRQPSHFVLLCALGLGMVGVSLGALVLTQAVSGTPIMWTTRSGAWAGGLYLLVAALVVERSGAAILPLERTLREVENRYKNLVDLSPNGITVDIGGTYVFANPAAARLFGARSPEALLGHNALDRVYPDDRDFIRERMGQVQSGAVTPPGEVRLLRLDGKPILVEASGSRVEFGGRLANQVVYRDITERKKAEEALKKSEERLSRAQEIAHLGSWELYLVDDQLTWSDEVYRIFGLEPQEFGATYEAFLEYVHRDDRVAVDAAYTGSLVEGRDSYEIEHRVVRRSTGEVRWVHEKCAHVRDAQGTIVRSVGMVLDITESKQAEQALRESEERYRVLAEENERLYRQQLDIAENLQAAILHIPSELGPVRLGHLYRSATEAARVGGDFYDVFQVKEGKIALLMGDVAGHGIEAARTATLVKDVVYAFIHQTLRTHEVLRRTNTLLIEKQLPDYVTLFLGILDPKTGELRYSSAGHPDMLMRRASGEIEHLPARSSPLGVYADAVWKPHRTELQADDLLVLFTDGVIEARRDGELFGEKRLETLVGGERIPAERLPDVILDQVLAFSEGMLRDDLAILTLGLTTKAEATASNEKSFTREKLTG